MSRVGVITLLRYKQNFCWTNTFSAGFLRNKPFIFSKTESRICVTTLNIICYIYNDKFVIIHDYCMLTYMKDRIKIIENGNEFELINADNNRNI